MTVSALEKYNKIPWEFAIYAGQERPHCEDDILAET